MPPETSLHCCLWTLHPKICALVTLQETTFHLQGPCSTQLLPRHLFCGITSEQTHARTEGGNWEEWMLLELLPQPAPPSPFPATGTWSPFTSVRTQHKIVPVHSSFIPPLEAWNSRFTTASWCQWVIWSSGIKHGCSFKSQLITDWELSSHFKSCPTKCLRTSSFFLTRMAGKIVHQLVRKITA